jgi:hypothetical protein
MPPEWLNVIGHLRWSNVECEQPLGREDGLATKMVEYYWPLGWLDVIGH